MDIEKLKEQFVSQFHFINRTLGTYGVKAVKRSTMDEYRLSIELFIHEIGSVEFGTIYDMIDGAPLKWEIICEGVHVVSKYGLRLALFEAGLQANEYYEKELEKAEKLRPVADRFVEQATRCHERWRD